MIKSENGIVEIDGKKIMVLADLTTVLFALRTAGVKSEEIDFAVKLSLKDFEKESQDREVKKVLEELLDKIFKEVSNGK